MSSLYIYWIYFFFHSQPPPLFMFNLNNSAAYNFNAEVSPNYGNAFKEGINCNCGRSAGGSTGENIFSLFKPLTC